MQRRLERWFYNIVPWNGFLEETYKCLRTEIPRIEPELALAYASALIGHVMHGTIEVGAAKLGTNFYLLVIGGTATAKSSSWIRLKNRLLKDLLSNRRLVQVHTGASFEGLAQYLAEYHSVIHFADEVQRIFMHRKRGGYLGDLVDLWKMAWYRDAIYMPRRSRSKSIEVPEDYMLTVIATTTPDDLEDVIDAIGDKALLRRFLPVKTNAVARYGEGEPADWRNVKAVVEFTERMAPIEFVMKNPRILTKIVDTITSSLGADPESWLNSLIDTYTIKFSAILVYDKLIAWLIRLLNQQRRGASRQPSTVSSTDLQHALSSYMESLNRFKEIPHVAIAQNSGTDTHADTGAGGAGDHCSESEVMNIVEELSKIIIYTVEDMSTTSILNVEARSRKALLSVEVPIGEPPVIEWDGTKLMIWIDELEVARAAFITVAYVFNNLWLYEMMGMDARWAYFTRRLRELKGKFDVVDMRLLARYMKKMGGYRELEDYVMKAIMAGYLTPTTRVSGPEDLVRVQFKITIPE